MKYAERAQRIEALDDLIRAIAWGREPSQRSLSALRAAAADLRAAMDGEPETALFELQRRIADAAATRTALGWNLGALRGIAEQTLAHWPTIRQALERFGAEIEEGRQ